MASDRRDGTQIYFGSGERLSIDEPFELVKAQLQAADGHWTLLHSNGAEVLVQRALVMFARSDDSASNAIEAMRLLTERQAQVPPR